MAHQGTIHWEGKSGATYKYYICDLNETHDAVPANYVFAKETKTDTYAPIYIGETEDISERFDNHHKINCIRRHGATHVHTHKSSADREVRCAEEADLIAKWQPLCND